MAQGRMVSLFGDIQPEGPWKGVWLSVHRRICSAGQGSGILRLNFHGLTPGDSWVLLNQYPYGLLLLSQVISQHLCYSFPSKFLVYAVILGQSLVRGRILRVATHSRNLGNQVGTYEACLLDGLPLYFLVPPPGVEMG